MQKLSHGGPFCSHLVSPCFAVTPSPLPVSFFPIRQVDNAKVLHYVGAGVAFPTSMLFVCLQSALTYRLAKTQGEYNVAHLRLCMTLLAFVALVLSILSSHKQMAASEAVKCFRIEQSTVCFTRNRDIASKFIPPFVFTVFFFCMKVPQGLKEKLFYKSFSSVKTYRYVLKEYFTFMLLTDASLGLKATKSTSEHRLVRFI